MRLCRPECGKAVPYQGGLGPFSPAAAPPGLSRGVARWISRYERFWNARLDRLEKFFATQEKSQ